MSSKRYNTKESLAKIKKYKESGDTRDLKGMKFDTDMVYADDEWKPTDEIITIGLNAIEKTRFGSSDGKEPTGAVGSNYCLRQERQANPEGGEGQVTKFIKSTMLMRNRQRICSNHLAENFQKENLSWQVKTSRIYLIYS